MLDPSRFPDLDRWPALDRNPQDARLAPEFSVLESSP